MEPEQVPGVGGALGVGHDELDVVEVVLHRRRRLDEPDAQTLGDVERDLPLGGALEPEAAVGQGRLRGGQVGDAQRHKLERPRVARAVRDEQRQLEPARIGADEGEGVRALDLVHAQMSRRERGDAVAVGDPERDVIQTQRAERHRA